MHPLKVGEFYTFPATQADAGVEYISHPLDLSHTALTRAWAGAMSRSQLALFIQGLPSACLANTTPSNGPDT